MSNKHNGALRSLREVPEEATGVNYGQRLKFGIEPGSTLDRCSSWESQLTVVD